MRHYEIPVGEDATIELPGLTAVKIYTTSREICVDDISGAADSLRGRRYRLEDHRGRAFGDSADILVLPGWTDDHTPVTPSTWTCQAMQSTYGNIQEFAAEMERRGGYQRVLDCTIPGCNGSGH